MWGEWNKNTHKNFFVFVVASISVCYLDRSNVVQTAKVARVGTEHRHKPPDACRLFHCYLFLRQEFSFFFFSFFDKHSLTGATCILQTVRVGKVGTEHRQELIGVFQWLLHCLLP